MIYQFKFPIAALCLGIVFLILGSFAKIQHYDFGAQAFTIGFAIIILSLVWFVVKVLMLKKG
jgi:cell shape-determining protein MreD